MTPWIWIAVIVAVWVTAVGFALALGAVAGRADEQARQMWADRCPDELEP